MLDRIVASYQSGLSLRATAALHGTNKKRVEAILSAASVPVRSRTAYLTDRSDPWRDAELMRRLYVDQRLSTLKIADMFQCDRSVVPEWLAKHGIPRRSLSESHLGQKPSRAGLGKRYSSEVVECACGCGQTRLRFGWNSTEGRFIAGHQGRGEGNPNWKGGCTPISNATRRTPAHMIWRKTVLERDNFTCQKCGVRGGKLHAHHLDNYAHHPERRFDPDNGVTLCKPCHSAFHRRYGHRDKTTASQFQEFKGSL